MAIMKKESVWGFCLLMAVLMGVATPLSAATLHVILVGDTNDDKIGRSVDVDLGRMGSLLKSLKDATKPEDTNKPKKLTLNVQRLDGHDLEQGRGYDNVTQAVNELSVNRDDVVMFYYSGHGMSQIPPWPSMGVEGGMAINKLLTLDWVITQIEAKNPRFFIVMADTCNIFPPPSRRSSIQTKQVENPLNYQKLFLGYKGFIIASSSTPGQASYGHPRKGGFFTTAFLKSLNQELASASECQADWNRIMERVLEKPLETNDPDQPTQQAQAKLELRAVSDFNCFKQEEEGHTNNPMCWYVGKPNPATHTCAKAQHYKKQCGRHEKTCCTDRYEREMCW